MVSNRTLLFQGPLFSGAFAVSFREEKWAMKKTWIPIGFRTSKVDVQSFLFKKESSKIWRILVFSNLAYKSMDGFSNAEGWSSLQDDDFLRETPQTSSTEIYHDCWDNRGSSNKVGWSFTEVFWFGGGCVSRLGSVVPFLVRSPRRSHERFKRWSNEKRPWLFKLYIGGVLYYPGI